MLDYILSCYCVGTVLVTEVMGYGLIRELHKRHPKWSDNYAAGLMAASIMLWPIFLPLSFIVAARR